MATRRRIADNLPATGARLCVISVSSVVYGGYFDKYIHMSYIFCKYVYVCCMFWLM
jgi:hypothetical protein